MSVCEAIFRTIGLFLRLPSLARIREASASSRFDLSTSKNISRLSVGIHCAVDSCAVARSGLRKISTVMYIICFIGSTFLG